MNSASLLSFGLFLLGILVGTLITGYYFHHATAQPVKQSYKGIILSDPKLEFEVVFKGLKNPTSMAFLGQNDILVLQKDNGTVKRIVNGNMLPYDLLDINVATEGGRGMLGIAVAKHENSESTYVFLYIIESSTVKDLDSQTGGKARLYRYELKDNKLIHPKLLLDVSGERGVGNKTNAFHNGGKVLIGPDQNVYLTVGEFSGRHTLAQNLKDRDPADGSSGILRITQDGEPVKGGDLLGDIDSLNKYYAYGIRNIFGIDFDPLTGNLWDTENGPDFGDEINLVRPGFNSGWRIVQGIWKVTPLKQSIGDVSKIKPDGLVDFGGKGKYSHPEFTWKHSVGPTALTFLDSDKLGKQYKNDMFVGDFTDGNIYHFELNENRTALSLAAPLADTVADTDIRDTDTEYKGILFGTGFDGLTDMQVGPDGYLYLLSYQYGAIFKIEKK
jgi:glucose/arabinose dehydrogenase